MLYHLLYPLHTEFSFLNVFRYLNFRGPVALATAFAISLLVGPLLIRVLQNHRVGQRIRTEGPSSHLDKSGTPTMGGVMILLSLVLSTLFWADLTNRYVWLVIFATLAFGLIGFLDDYLKFVKNRSEGLWPRHKFGLQILVALMIGIILYYSPAYSTRLHIPFFKNLHPDLGWWYILFTLLVIVGASNAVNLTDGLDGLAVGPLTVAAVAYAIIVYVVGHKEFADYLLIPYVKGSGELTIFCAAMVGASLGFLWFNAYPASIFMGDVGSLSLGGALGTLAIISKHELLLMLIGGIFVFETASVIFQVASYKSSGRRVFLMSPIHHHFELKGWEEPKIVVRFWIIAVILALLSLTTLKLR